MLYLKIALIAGILIATPAIMTQVWLFVAPGLYTHEKKLAIPFVLMATVFFVAGLGIRPLRRLSPDVEVLRQFRERAG